MQGLEYFSTPKLRFCITLVPLIYMIRTGPERNLYSVTPSASLHPLHTHDACCNGLENVPHDPLLLPHRSAATTGRMHGGEVQGARGV